MSASPAFAVHVCYNVNAFTHVCASCRFLNSFTVAIPNRKTKMSSSTGKGRKIKQIKGRLLYLEEIHTKLYMFHELLK